MKEEKDDFSDLEPVNTPVDSYEIRRMMMAFMIVPARLVKLKRLVGTLYRKDVDNV
jgi:hypothetical protein